MKLQKGTVLALAGTLLLGALSGCSNESEMGEGTPAEVVGTPANGEWEYAAFGYDNMRLPAIAWWSGPDERFRGSTYKELAKQLKLEINHNGWIALLNALGARGWELASSTSIMNHHNGAIQETWTLKRRK